MFQTILRVAAEAVVETYQMSKSIFQSKLIPIPLFKLLKSIFYPNEICTFISMGEISQGVQSMEMMSYFFVFFGHCFQQFRGLESQEMKYFLQIYECPSEELLSYQPYQPFI